MKELRKRINGLIALMLAVCLVMEMTGVQVCATEYTFGDYYCSFNCDTIKDRVLYPGDTLKWGNSGGYFIVTYPEADSENSIGSYITPYPYDNDSYTCNKSLLVNSLIPGMYDGIKITDAISTPDNGPDGKEIKKLTLGWYQQYRRYNLHFETNGGTEVEALADIENCKFDSGVTYGLYNGSTKLTRPGYSFLGWDYNQNATSPVYTADSEYKLPDTTHSTITNGQTINLYAIWKPITYKATFGQGSVVGADPPSGTDMISREGNVENPVKLPACTYSLPNYHFVGWKLISVENHSDYTSVGQTFLAESVMDYTPPTDNCVMDFEAQWAPNTVTISYNANGGTGSIADSTYTYGTSSASISLPGVSGSMTKPNYHFKGWCKDADGSSEIMSEGASYSLDYSSGNQNITLYAIWEPNTITISYDANGGEGSIAGSTYTYGSSLASISLPGVSGSMTKSNYHFKGWSEDAVDSSTIMSEDYSYSLNYSSGNQNITLYAIWEPNAYSIRFNGNGGTGEMDNQAGISFTPLTLNANQFTSIDQMFAGWSTTGTGTVQYVDQDTFDYTASTNNQIVDLFAIWTKMYKLAFDANGGTGTMETLQNGMDGVAQTLPSCAYTKEGFGFQGWSTNPNATTAEYQQEDSFIYFPTSAGETVTLYAIWKPYMYSATFNRGSVGQNSPSGDDMGVIRNMVSTTLTLPECTYLLSNYHFAGWKLKAVTGATSAANVDTIYPAGTTVDNISLLGDSGLTFEAQWAPNTVTISYNANGGEGSIADSTYTYGSSDNSITLSNANSMSKANYHFKGWCENASDSSTIIGEGQQYTLDYSSDNRNITFYAIWEPNAYSIRFNGNGGTGEMSNQAGISFTPLTLNANQFTSIDQMFAGWSTTGTGTVQYADRASFDYQASTNNQTVDLFAIWTKMYKLAFDANGGSGTMGTPQSGIDGISQTLPSCVYTKEGFEFQGWSTNPDATIAEYQPGGSFSYSPSTAGETVTLYAIWKEESNHAESIPVGLGTTYLTSGQAYIFGSDGSYIVDGDPTIYPMNTTFYVAESGYYTITVQ